ncbi:MAG: cell division protein ZapE [Pseudomonadota bacterium]
MKQPLSPQQRYAQDLRRADFVSDDAQAQAVQALQKVHDELVAKPPKKRLGKLRWPRVQGLYLWGGVGRGKTYLMDAFYESLPFTRKRRTHFHRFMLEVHAQCAKASGRKDPLVWVAKSIAEKTRVLCFDEFFVSDIADAMILGRLTDALFAEGVVLIATSNVAPDLLYKDGLQRQNFLPAIARLKQNCAVLQVGGDVDYRLRALTAAEIYHHPCDDAAETNLARWFAQIAPPPSTQTELRIEGRAIAARKLAEGAAWFDFAPLCATARSAADYIEIARTHHSVLLSRVPVLGVNDDDAARRFITLVDEFYDRGVKLILAADAPLEKLYAGKRLGFEFRRTRSRLQEMQSTEYLARPHLS